MSSGENAVRVAGTLIGRQNRPHLLEAWGQRFDIQLEEHVTLFRYRDLPGMLGRVGTAFGAAGVNIISAAVGRLPEGVENAEGLAAMAITTSEPVPQAVVDEIASERGLRARRDRRAGLAGGPSATRGPGGWLGALSGDLVVLTSDRERVHGPGHPAEQHQTPAGAAGVDGRRSPSRRSRPPSRAAPHATHRGRPARRPA